MAATSADRKANARAGIAPAKLDLRQRPRRLRQTDWTRRLVRQNTVTADDLIWPIFIIDGDNRREPVASMPRVDRITIDFAVREAERAAKLGIPALALFPNTDPALRDENGSQALNEDNLICRACRAIKREVPDIGLMTDVALDPYTSHGQDGVMRGEEILNDESVAILAQQALVQARAGCDIIAPSDMMDGRIGAIRTALDGENFEAVQIMAYSAKYASAFYGPFREAVGSGGLLKGDKRTYQMDPGNSDEALKEVGLDLEQGADMVMVKPGMPYLDICRRVKDRFGVPTFAYQVSGEYAMIQGAVERGWLDGAKVWPEAMQCFKRAGADGVLTYAAVDIARRLGVGRS